MKLARVQVFRYNLPLRQPMPLRGGLLSERCGFLLKLTAESGAVGWGEAAPLPGFSDESFEAAEGIMESVPRRLAGLRLPARYEDLEGTGLLFVPGSMAAGFAIESAYFNLMANAAGVPLHRYLRSDAPDRIAMNALLAGAPEAVLQRVEALRKAGFAAVKLKVGGRHIEEDIALVKDLHALLGPAVALRLDANRQWDLETATYFGRAVSHCAIDYIEEPLRDFADLPLLRERTGVPYALDETLQSGLRGVRERLRRITAGAAAEGIGLPVPTPELRAYIHELTAAFRHAAACIWKPTLLYDANLGSLMGRKDFGLPINRLVVTGAFESGVGIATLGAYAAAYGSADTPCGLDTYNWLADDVLAGRLPLDGPGVDLNAMHAAAAQVDESKLTLICEE